MDKRDLDAIERDLRDVYLAPGIADAFAKLRRERDALLKELDKEKAPPRNGA